MRLPEDSPWMNYRRWTWGMWVSLPVFYIIILRRNWFPEMAAFVVAAPCFVSMIAVRYFKCPRCKKRFFKDDTWHLGAKSCVHCGLPKWEGADFVGSVFESPLYQDPPIAEMASDTGAGRNLRFLTLVLRDDPGAIHLTLDPDGWADVTNLLTRTNRYGFKLGGKDLVTLAEGDGEPGFELDSSAGRIRLRRKPII
jgi:hypothetical protein